ncbi:cobyrinate a,c-diamide synthase [Mycolicibacter sinensis]|uniref:Hydrogenobyrinate a,c-diamide synthase n=1 Tax=Mycolicibacter sinensis (strain JDM601) TaxID=875328 RepID=A0A1A3U076_MYCSD|nr:cobyrinate a,c-diamide synthase [Mycolicibacter sinensis]OBK88280.1 cobyrinic acid a,c-diamide synthase [Mycolicibacter sinensis]
MVSLPRIVVAAPASGHGKTTVAVGLMAALAARGLSISGHKVGPDYIDPGYHALATGRPARNLDPVLVGAERIVPLLLHGASCAEIAVIEGVMGLFDGRLGSDGEASTAHVAALTESPVLLVVDISHASRTHAAVVAGLAGFDPHVRVAGVILNQAGSARHADEVVAALRPTGIPVLGVLPRDAGVQAPSRHLGLVPAAERDESGAMLDRLAGLIARQVDLDAVVAVARRAPDLVGAVWDPAAEVRAGSSPPRPVVAVAGGRAFTFGYTETFELLRAAGCEVVCFDPLTDSGLPAGTAGIYLGGGFPEVYAAELAANTALAGALRAAIAAGVPTVAECGGLAYLCRSVGEVPGVGALSAAAKMSPRLTLGYREAVAPTDSLLAEAGLRVTGHEFHRTVVTFTGPVAAAWQLPDGPDGIAGPSLHASYLHTHWAGYPQLAQRFADAVHQFTGPDLHHHGDTEARAGLADFAVNVYVGSRPDWLDAALHASLADAAAYPDAGAARDALAARHGVSREAVLPTAGASEAFDLVARLRAWRRPMVVHPQYTGPHAALIAAGHSVDVVLCRAEDGFALDPAAVPDDADLVVVGNPTNPTGVLHPASLLLSLLRPGRVVLVDEAFLDAVPGEPESLAGFSQPGLLVTRSLTKHWSIPGVRAGYLLGDPLLIADAARLQIPWSVSAPALAAMLACSDSRALAESECRAERLALWRDQLTAALVARGVPLAAGVAPYVLARLGAGVHAALRENGIAVRRADTFPGLDDSWVRIAVRPPELTDRLLAALDRILG